MGEPRIGKYSILKRLSADSISELFLTRSDGAGGFHRRFIIKRFRPLFSRNVAFIPALAREVRRAATLSHSNIVQTLNLGQSRDLYYVVMEYVQGRNMGEFLGQLERSGQLLQLDGILEIGMQLCRALEYAHSERARGRHEAMAHGQLSPSNVLLSYRGDVKVSDFGLASITAHAREGLTQWNRSQMSSSLELGVQDDLYRLSCMLCELMTGSPPSENISSNSDWQLLTDPQKDFLSRALSRELGRRYGTATELRKALEELAVQEGCSPRVQTLTDALQMLFSSGRDADSEDPTVPIQRMQRRPSPADDTLPDAVKLHTMAPAKTRPIRLEALPPQGPRGGKIAGGETIESHPIQLGARSHFAQRTVDLAMEVIEPGSREEESSISEVDLSAVESSEADLSLVDLSAVEASEAGLSLVELSAVESSEADLSLVDLSAVEPSEVDLSAAELDQHLGSSPEPEPPVSARSAPLIERSPPPISPPAPSAPSDFTPPPVPSRSPPPPYSSDSVPGAPRSLPPLNMQTERGFQLQSSPSQWSLWAMLLLGVVVGAGVMLLLPSGPSALELSTELPPNCRLLIDQQPVSAGERVPLSSGETALLQLMDGEEIIWTEHLQVTENTLRILPLPQGCGSRELSLPAEPSP